MRRGRRLGALAPALAVVGCGGAPGAGSRAAATAVPHNRAAATAPVVRWRCPAGADLALDLDGDGVADRVRLAPTAEAVSCLEIHPSTAPALVCSDAERRFLPLVEVDHGRPVERGVYRCDPQGAAIRAVTPPAPSTRPVASAGIPTGRTYELAMLGAAAPAHAALWLDGGDASAAITWLDGRWAWIELGF